MFIKTAMKCLITLYFNKLILKLSNIYKNIMQVIHIKTKRNAHPITFHRIPLQDVAIKFYYQLSQMLHCNILYVNQIKIFIFKQ